MKLTINGNLNTYYAQTLCLLFFPGAKFSQSEEITPDTPIVHMELAEQENEGVQVTVHIQIGDQLAEGAHYASYRRHGMEEWELIRKIAAGKAMIAAGKQMFGAAPPWGLMTGVRPAKIAAGLFERGMTSDAVRTALRREFFLNPKKAALLTTITENENKIISAMPQNSCSVYVSIPFCPTRCDYCSFVSQTVTRAAKLMPQYVELLMQELAYTGRLVRELGLRLETVYFGGGTPTTLSASQLEQLTAAVAEHFDLSTVREYTVEAGRPDTVTRDKLAVLKQAGVSRISINPQTLCDEVLETIGRKHTVAQFYEAFDLARRTGHTNINTDLIAGLPGDTFNGFSQTLDGILKLSPESVTVHTLSMKRASNLSLQKRADYRVADEAVQMVALTAEQLPRHQYHPYYLYRQSRTVGNQENVGWAKAGYESLYNVYIMDETHTILGCGAGAVSKLKRPGTDYLERIFNYKFPYEYIAGLDEMLLRKDYIREFYKGETLL